MRTAHRFSGVCVYLLVAVAMSGAAPQDEGDGPFAPRLDTAFGNATVPIKEFLRDRHVYSSTVQHFCVVGYQGASGKQAWVHWSEGNKIISWLGATNLQGAKTSMARSRRIVDLKKSVVDSEADLKGSSYFVTRAWVSRILSDCQTRGEKYEIRNGTRLK